MQDPRSPGDPELASLLGKLTRDEQHKPWFATIGRDLKETLFPPKLPPLELTSAPMPVRDIWGFSEGRRAHSGLSSLAIHVALVGLALWLGTNKFVQEQVAKNAPRIDLTPYLNALKPAANRLGGGGGGGDQATLPASKGALPKVALKQFVPPSAVVRNEQPKLEMDPTIIVQADAPLLQVDMKVFGDPLARVGPPSNGPGLNGGIGSGSRGGVGPGDGRGFGPGSGDNTGGEFYRAGTGGVLSPIPLFKPDPEYSEEARKAKHQGSVRLQIVVDERGNPRDVTVIRSLGLGLNEKAMEAVKKWRFRAGTKDGRAVPVLAVIDVNFRLL